MENLIGGRIADLRRKKGLTQIQLAEKLNISDKAVSKWESGKCDPSLEMLVALSNFFECTIDYIVKGEDNNLKVKTNLIPKRFEFFPLVKYYMALGEIDSKITEDDFVKLFNLRPVRIDGDCLYLIPDNKDFDQLTVSSFAVDLLLEKISEGDKRIKKIKLLTDKVYDPLFKDSVRIVIKNGVASVARLQRKFGIGYPRALKLIEEMERNDFISVADKDCKRKVYIAAEKFKELFGEEV